ncbi:MAG: hypothetical protein U0354_06915 [Candidatus Sericytochromatia bacterium]
MDEEQLKILEMVANRTITPEEAAKLLNDINNDEYTYHEDFKTNNFDIEEHDYNNEEQLDIDLDLGVTNFKLSKTEENKLFRIQHNKGENFSHKIIFSHRELQIRNQFKPVNFDIGSLKRFVDPNSKKCFVELNPKVKLYMKVKFGGGKALFDFTDLKIKRLRLSSGASDTRICFNKFNTEELDYLKIESGASNLSIIGISNANCSEIDLNLGASNATLDFSGQLNKEIYCEAVMRVGRLQLLVPREYGVKLKTTDKLANLSLPDFYSKDGYKVSDNINKVDQIINLRIDSTLAQVSLSWI